MEVEPETMPAGEACGIRGMECSSPLPRWRIEDGDSDMQQAAAIFAVWNGDARREKTSADEEAKNLRRDINAACDASMPRSVPGARQNAYWWTAEIAELRTTCVHARRRLQKARRRRPHDEEEISLYYEAYRRARQILQQNVKSAKAQFRMDLVQSADSDP